MIRVLRLTLSITIVFERIMLRDIRAIQMWQAQEHLRIQRRRQLRTNGNSYTDRNVDPEANSNFHTYFNACTHRTPTAPATPTSRPTLTPTSTPIPNPHPPSEVTASVVGCHEIDLTWTYLFADETGLNIDRRVNGENYKRIAQVGAADRVTGQ